MIKKLSLVLGIMVLLLLSATIVQAKYYYLTIPACAFLPYSPSTTPLYRDLWSVWVNDSDDYEAHLYTPIYLPDNAELKEVKIFCFDLSVTGDIKFEVYYVTHSNSSYYKLFSLRTYDTPGKTSKTWLPYWSKYIKYTNYKWIARIRFTKRVRDKLKFYGLRIKYWISE